MFFQITGIRKQMIIASCVYLGQMVVGYTLGWTTSAIPKLRDPNLSPVPEKITDLQMSFVGSILLLGGLPGPYITGYLANVKGRKLCMLLGSIITIVAYVILARAVTLVMLYVGRIVCGFGAGIITVMALVYLGEIASTDIRGIFLTGIGIFITGGSLFAFSIGPFVSFSMAAYIGALLASLYTAALLWIPETPTYYALKDKENAVKLILEDLGRIDDLDKVLLQTKEEDSLKDWKELFYLKSNRKALGITVILNVAQQGSGIVAVTFFATTIFELAETSIEPALATIILGFIQLFGGLITPIFIERSGRRTLLLISTATCCLSMVILGVYFYLNHIDHWVVPGVKWLPVTALVIFYVGYDAGLGIIPNALSGEMFEPNVRSKGCGVAITIAWLTGFAVITAVGSLINTVGGHPIFWFFSAVCAFTFLYTIFFVPETKGKSLKEIQEMLKE